MEEALDDWIGVQADNDASSRGGAIGFSHMIIRTVLSSYKRPTKRPFRLVHFMLRQANSA
jgi:hypothetical protein